MLLVSSEYIEDDGPQDPEQNVISTGSTVVQLLIRNWMVFLRFKQPVRGVQVLQQPFESVFSVPGTQFSGSNCGHVMRFSVCTNSSRSCLHSYLVQLSFGGDQDSEGLITTEGKPGSSNTHLVFLHN